MKLFEHKGYYVSFCDDVGVNEGGYYCQVYTDNWMCYEIDNFVIRKSQISSLDKEDIARKYIDDNIEFYNQNQIKFEIIK